MQRRTLIATGAALAAGAFGPRQSRAADAPVKLRIAEAARSYFYTPMYAAIGKGFAKAQGLDVEVTTANGGDRVGALVLAGGTDVGLAGPEVPIYIVNGESPDKPAIFCALTGTDGFFLASHTKLDKFEWSMLNGKKIIGYRPGSTPQLYLEYVLKLKGVDPATIKSVITNIAPAARVGAFLSGAADFGTFLDPDLSTLEKAGQATMVASIGAQVGRADYTAFFANRSWLAKNADTAQRWTNAIDAAQDYVKTASPAEIAAATAQFFPGIAVADTVTAIDRIRNSGAPIWAGSPLVNEAGLAKLEEIMESGGTLTKDKAPSYAALVDRHFADAAMAKAGK
jgi:NitT/TauT family transport system substrate-binding protein